MPDTHLIDNVETPLAVTAVVFGGSCDSHAQVSNVAVPPVVPPSEVETKAQDASVCDLKNDPAKYNQKQVKLTGYFSRGFEDSVLYDPACKTTNQWIWVEIGGKRSVGVMYCCGFTPKSTRDEELEVEGLKLPLVDDERFKAYDKLFDGKQTVKATVIGTFFSGEKLQYVKDGPTYYVGYGHLGIGSLFIVLQVLSSEKSKVGNKIRVE